MQTIPGPMYSNYGSSQYTANLTNTAQPLSIPYVTDTTANTTAASAIIATDAVKTTVSECDLTSITPDQVSVLSDNLFEEGSISVQQLVRLHSIALNYQHPPHSDGIYREETANNTPFDLLKYVEARQQQSPLTHESEPLFEILLGLQKCA